MSTEKQIEANRANAQKSTGPRTEKGKSRAALNAIKHGGTAQTMIFPGEDCSHFNNFTSSFIETLKPANPVELALVNRLSKTEWSMERMRAYEAGIFALGHEANAERVSADGDQVIQAAFAGALSFKLELEAVKNIGLYLSRAGRLYDQTLKQLHLLQDRRKSQRQADLLQTANFAMQHKRIGIPFVAGDFGFVCSAEEYAPVQRRMEFDETYIRRFSTSKTAPVAVKNAA